MNCNTIDQAVSAAFAREHFFVAPPLELRVACVAQESLSWEVFLGHLLDPAHTRQSRDFRSWHLFLDRKVNSSPILSIHQDAEAKELYVTRQILTRGFEAYEDTPGVILSRPVEKWSRELVASIDVSKLADVALRPVLCEAVFRCIIGTSRLPITSLESPLPAYSLGEIGYLPLETSHQHTDALEFLAAALGQQSDILARAKALETALRALSPPDAPRIAEVLIDGWATTGASRRAGRQLTLALFRNVALSPYTSFVDSLMALLVALAEREELGIEWALDVVSTMLTGLCGHLTAYDLTLFHNFGANYPDALFLDSLLKSLLQFIERHPNLIVGDASDSPSKARRKQLRRRALRQACLARRQYEGHAVPDAPTSLGESARVLPPTLPVVPEEQIVEVGKRRRRLFVDEPTNVLLGEQGRRALMEGIADLANDDELSQLGRAIFLDRPLGALKQAGEVDRTPLIAYVAFSRAIARRRAILLSSAGWISRDARQELETRIAALPRAGVAVGSIGTIERAGVVSLADAQKSAADFMLLRSTRDSLDELLSYYDWTPLANLAPTLFEWLSTDSEVVLLAEAKLDIQHPPTLAAYDGQGKLRIRLGLGQPGGGQRYLTYGSMELPSRLEVLQIEATSLNNNAADALAGRSLWIAARA